MTTASTDATEPVDVLIVGAGPAGLTLAIDLLRRGLAIRIVSAAPGDFPGSRAKGVQPRTLEVFDDLGVLTEIRAHGRDYPPLGEHRDGRIITHEMAERREPTEAVPYPNGLMVAQHDTDAVLRRRVEELGGVVEFDTRFVELEQDADGVTATVHGPAGAQRIRSRYLAGADGGSSAVRAATGVAFPGTTDETDRMLIADLVVSGLDRDHWHMWPAPRLALCPLPDGETFQLMVKLDPDEPVDVDRAALEARIRRHPDTVDLTVEEVRWSSVWRPNIRLAERYRSGRVLLLGDAAHVHPPTGGQGMNTAIGDAYNLGWKLGQVLAGAPDALLDSYEDERRPIAARVLGLSTHLYERTAGQRIASMARGEEERQLTLSYRGGPLASGPDPAADGSAAVLQAGDRVPDVCWQDADGQQQRLFDHLRGPHFTVLAIGDAAVPVEVPWPAVGAALHRVPVAGTAAAHVADAFGLGGPALVLIRPDGYLAAVRPVGDPDLGRMPEADTVTTFTALALPERQPTR